jgi:hypothetical protein
VRTADPIAFIDKVKNEVKRKDSHELVALMQDITGEPPKMWGPSIVGDHAAECTRALRTFTFIGHDVPTST